MKNRFMAAAVLVLAVLASGCSGGASVSGNVKFSDGSPLTVGTVSFVNNEATFYGTLGGDGSYSIQGMTSGDFDVYISGAEMVSGSDDVKLDADGNPINYRPNDGMPTRLIASKYASSTTSGWSCKVAGAVTYDMTVEKP